MDRHGDGVHLCQRTCVTTPPAGKPRKGLPAEKGFADRREEEQQDREEGPGDTELRESLRPWHGAIVEGPKPAIVHKPDSGTDSLLPWSPQRVTVGVSQVTQRTVVSGPP